MKNKALLLFALVLSVAGEKGHWTVEPGDFTLLVGSSSADADLKPLNFSYLRKN